MGRACRVLWPLILALVAPAVAGCSSIRPPGVRVSEVAVVERTEEALTLEFGLDLHNPNGEPLELISFDYHASVDGRRVFEGRWAAQATLAPRGSNRLTIPAVVRFDRADWESSGVPAEAQVAVSGRLLYLTPGALAEILLDTGVRRPRVRFSGRGQASLAAPAADETVADG
jgi:hypothetical protein